jgi:hypothetical protein
MKKLMRNISLFDVISTLTVLAVLSAMLFSGIGNITANAQDDTEVKLITEDDRPDGINESDNIRGLILGIIQFLLGFVGVIAVGFVIYAGFLMMTAGGNEDQIGNGKKIILWAAIGIIVILLSWVIIDLVVDLGSGGNVE